MSTVNSGTSSVPIAVSTLVDSATTIAIELTSKMTTNSVEKTTLGDLTTEYFNFTGNNTNATVATPPGLSKTTLALAKANEWTMTITLVIIMLGMGATMTLKELWKNIRRPYGIIIGAVSQFIIMPLCGFGMAHLTNMSAPYAIGTLIICCCPGGTLSNIFCYWSDGDTVLSICMTSCSTLLAIGMMPLNLFIYSRSWIEPGGDVIPFVDIIISLVAIVVPAAIGCFIKYKFPKAATLITKVSSVVGLLGIVAALVFVVLLNPDMFNTGWEAWVTSATLPLWGFCFGYLISTIFRLKQAKRRTVAFETGCQNVALALTIISLSYPPSKDRALMMVVPSLFGPFMTIDALFFVILFKCIKHFRSKPEDDDKETIVNKKAAEANGNVNGKVVATKVPEELKLDHVMYADASVNTDESYTNYGFTL
ncbi:ileal sodium/bile acid cotransporter-like [Glandiceps talaboti]